MYKACRKSTSTLNLRRIKPWWSFKEEDNFYPSMRKWWSFLFKDSFLTELSYSSVIVFGLFLNVSSHSLSELWIPWLHEPDRCSAAQVRFILASSAFQEASALLQDYCSQCHTTRQKKFLPQRKCISYPLQLKANCWQAHEVRCHSTHGSSLSCVLNSY